jgi:hypothetical protein
MLLANEVQAMRVFICAARVEGRAIATINATATLDGIFIFRASFRVDVDGSSIS